MLRIALGCALAALIIWFCAFHVGPLQTADAAVLWALGHLEETPVEWLTSAVVKLIEPVAYALICLALVVAAAAVRGPWTAGAVALLLVGANATTQLLKPALADPRLHSLVEPPIAAASWPSGHATAAAAAALAAMLVDARTRRLGIPLALAIGVAVVVDDWHYPSDVLGGYAVAGAWAAGAVALLRRRRPAATAAPRRRSPRATG